MSYPSVLHTHREQNVDKELKAILNGRTLMNLQQLIVEQIKVHDDSWTGRVPPDIPKVLRHKESNVLQGLTVSAAEPRVGN